jgi:hypothetical protein
MTATPEDHSTIDYIPVDQMQPYRLNRETVNEAFIAKIVRTMDLDKLGCFVVNRNRKTSVITIIDGHHRGEALKRFGWGDVPVRCVVFENLTDSQISDLVVAYGDRIATKAWDRFKNAVEAGHPDETAIVGILAEFSLRAAKGADSHSIAAVTALLRVYRIPGCYAKRGVALQETMRLITTCWPDNPVGLAGDVVSGLGIFLARHGEEIDRSSIDSRLTSLSGGPGGLLGQARQMREIHGGSIANQVACVVTMQYNRGRRSGRLPDWH